MEVSFSDIRAKLRIKTGNEQSSQLQQHQSLVLVATAVMGGGEGSNTSTAQNNEPATVIDSAAQLQSMLNGLKKP